MKIYEIITEEQKVDEFLGAIPGVTRAADAAKKAYQGYQRGKDLKAAQAARKARNAKNIFGQYKYSLKGLKGQDRIDMIAKRAAASASAAAKAKNGFALVPSLGTVLQALGATTIVYNYLTQIAAVEEDFEEFKAAIAAGKKVENADNMFAEFSSVKDAREKALETREELLGYASAQLLAVTGLAGKFVSVLGSALKIVPVFGPLVGYPMQGFGWLLSKLGGSNTAMAVSVRTALVAWISSPQGIEFIRKWSDGLLIALGGMVTDWLGKGVAFAIDTMMELADEAAKWVSEKTGLEIAVPDAAKSKLTPTKAEKDAEAAAGGIAGPSGPVINGIAITDKDGFLRSDPDFYNNMKIRIAVKQALEKGQPNPLDQAKRKPGVQYPTFNMTTKQFV
jgi:hypothetical protein